MLQEHYHYGDTEKWRKRRNEETEHGNLFSLKEREGHEFTRAVQAMGISALAAEANGFQRVANSRFLDSAESFASE
jgi:hypothetical protein